MTAVTVRDILTLPALEGFRVLGGGAGLERPVTGVNVMEVPDIESFVKSGELLLTTAYPVRERPERLIELLSALGDRGLAALAIKPLRYVSELPEGLAAEAERLAFPVLVLPDHTSFNEVMGAVLAVVLADYGAEPRRAEAIRERLTGVALAGGGLQEIARTLAGALDREVTIIDEEEEVLTVGTADADPSTPSGGHTWQFPITVARTPRGRVLVGGAEEPTLGQRRLIRQSCFAAGMHIAQALASLELDRRLRVLFLEELVTGSSVDEPLLRQRARLFGWDLTGAHHVLLASCGVEVADAAVVAACDRVLPRGSLAWSRGPQVVVIAPRDAPQRPTGDTSRTSTELAWRQALVDLGAGAVSVSVGSVAHTPLELAASHAAAHETLQIARASGRVAARHDELVLERLLLTVPRHVLEELVEQELRPLLDHDRETDADLCGTLEAYLGVGNGAEAARRLFIHYNTMKHRLARITELTGADLHDPRTRLLLALSLEIRKLV